MKINYTYLSQNKSRLLILMVLMFLGFVFLLPINSCKNKHKQVKIFGKIENAENSEIYLEMLLPGQIASFVQTKINEKGEFKFELDSLQTCFYRLKIDERNTIYLRLNPNDEIEIYASYPNIQTNYTIEGSEESKNLKELNMYLMKSTKRLNEINDQIVAAYKIPNYDVDSLIEVLNVEARAMYKNDKEFLINFIKKQVRKAD